MQRSVEVYQDPKYIVTKPRMGLRGICSGQSDTGTRFSFSPFHCHSLLKFHSHAIDAAYSLSTLTASFNEMLPTMNDIFKFQVSSFKFQVDHSHE